VALHPLECKRPEEEENWNRYDQCSQAKAVANGGVVMKPRHRESLSKVELPGMFARMPPNIIPHNSRRVYEFNRYHHGT
jgi:hypothetical protein